MATTTTINPTKDNWLAEGNPTSKYGNGALVQIGVSGGIKYMNGIFEFDVSGYTSPSDVVSATFTLTASASVGSANTMTLARLSQDFGESTSNYNTYDGSNTWVTGGTGDAEKTETTYTFGVGTTTDISVDIKELVVDAVTRRAGILRFICFLDGTPATSGYTKFYSRTTGAGTPPALAVTVADRITWAGDVDSDVDNYRNWAGYVIPTADDYALFTNTVDATTGTLTCHTLQIGRTYTGTISTATECQRVHMFAPRATLNGRFNTSLSSQADCHVGDCKALGTSGKHDLTLSRSRDLSALTTDLVNRIDVHSSRVSFSASDSVATVRLSDCRFVLSDGVGTLTANGRANGTLEATTSTTSDIVLSGGHVRIMAEEIDDVTAYSGRLTYRNNVGAPIATGDLVLYSGIIDTRTDSATYDAATITIYGGRLLLDGSQEVTLS